jgi:hypothetical protein
LPSQRINLERGCCHDCSHSHSNTPNKACKHLRARPTHTHIHYTPPPDTPPSDSRVSFFQSLSIIRAREENFQFRTFSCTFDREHPHNKRPHTSSRKILLLLCAFCVFCINKENVEVLNISLCFRATNN